MFDTNEIEATVKQMTESHLHNIMQLAVFLTANREIYAVNIAKVQNFVILDEIEIVKNHDQDSLVLGVAKIRDELVTFVNLDRWLGIKDIDENLYKIGIVCNLNNQRVGFLVQEIIGIEDRLSSELRSATSKEMKVLYVTTILQSGVEKSCAVFDLERLTIDAKLVEERIAVDDVRFDHSGKLVLIAEDSPVVVAKQREFLDSLGVNYHIFLNGSELIKSLSNFDPDDIALIITDLEMPVADGFQVISQIKSSSKYAHLPVVINSSMTSDGVREKATKLGAKEMLNKTDISSFYEVLKRYLKVGL